MYDLATCPVSCGQDCLRILGALGPWTRATQMGPSVLQTRAVLAVGNGLPTGVLIRDDSSVHCHAALRTR